MHYPLQRSLCSPGKCKMVHWLCFLNNCLNFLYFIRRAWCHVPSQIRGQCSEKVTALCPNTAPWEWCVSAHRTTEDPTNNAGDNLISAQVPHSADTILESVRNISSDLLCWVDRTSPSHTTIPTCLYIVEVLLLTFVLWYKCFSCIFEVLQYSCFRIFVTCLEITLSCFCPMCNYLGFAARDLGSLHFTTIVLAFSLLTSSNRFRVY